MNVLSNEILINIFKYINDNNLKELTLIDKSIFNLAEVIWEERSKKKFSEAYLKYKEKISLYWSSWNNFYHTYSIVRGKVKEFDIVKLVEYNQLNILKNIELTIFDACWITIHGVKLAIENGNIDIANWIMNNAAIIVNNCNNYNHKYDFIIKNNDYDNFDFVLNMINFEKILKRNDFKTLQWIKKKFDKKSFYYNLLCQSDTAICAYGHVNLLNHLYEKYNVFPNHRRGIHVAIENGHDNILEWLEKKFHYFSNEKYGYQDYQDSIEKAIIKGHTNILEWFKKHNLNNYLFISENLINKLAENGLLNVIQWYYDNDFINSKGDIKYKEIGYINHSWKITAEIAAENGYLNILEWIEIHNFEYITNELANLAAKSNSIHILNWLKIRNCYPCFNGINLAAEFGSLEAFIWIKDNCEFFPPLYEVLNKETVNKIAGNGYVSILDLIDCEMNELCSLSQDEKLNHLPNHKGADLAAENGHVNVLEWMKRHNLDSPTMRGIDYVIRNGHDQVIKWAFDNFLILPDKLNRDSIYYAFLHNKFTILKLLEEYNVIRHYSQFVLIDINLLLENNYVEALDYYFSTGKKSIPYLSSNSLYKLIDKGFLDMIELFSKHSVLHILLGY